MDPLKIPRSSKHDPILVPYLAVESFDGDDFGSYPSRRGWYDYDILKMGASTRSMDERATFVQS